MQKAVSNLVEDKKKVLLEKFETFFSNLDNIDTQARIYTTNGDPKKANQVIKDIGKAEEDFSTLVDVFDSAKTGTSEQMSLPMEENKQKSKKDLDKLIKEVILNKNK